MFRRPDHSRPAGGRTARGAALGSSLALAAAVAACGGGGAEGAASRPDQGDAPAHADGDHHHENATVAPDDRCDLGFNTAEFNEAATLVDHLHHDHQAHAGPDAEVGYSAEEWAEVYVDEELGMSVEEVLAGLEEDTLWWTGEPSLRAGESLALRMVERGGFGPRIEADPWVPMTDPAECEQLAGELRTSWEAAAEHPTVADAEAAGFRLITPLKPGLGAHYLDTTVEDASFDPAAPLQRMYAGTHPDAPLVGLAYWIQDPDTTPPAGFTGDNDLWHLHDSVCVDTGGVLIAIDIVTEQECAERAGTLVEDVNGWMVHAWVVPGCESPWGVFSDSNPRLPYIPEGAPFDAGCNTGRVVTEPPALDGQGDGPTVGP